MEPPWKKARETAKVRVAFFQHLIAATTFAICPAWKTLLQAITDFKIPPHCLLQDIPLLRQTPKILWIDDAEVVGD